MLTKLIFGPGCSWLQLAGLENRNLTPVMRGHSRLTGAVSQLWAVGRYGQDAMSRIRWRLLVCGHELLPTVISPERQHRPRDDLGPNLPAGHDVLAA